MKDVFLYGINSVVPLLLLIALGYVLRKKNYLSKSFFNECQWFCFHLAIPCMCYNNVYNIATFQQINWYPILYGILMTFLFFAIGLLVAQIFFTHNSQRGVVIQCFYRSNFGTMGVALAQMLGNGESSEVAALMAAGTAISFNVLAVISLSIYQEKDGKRLPPKSVLLNIAKNPLIVGVVLGFITLLIRALMPRTSAGELLFSLKYNLRFIFTVLQNLATIAAPLILICIGGQCDFDDKIEMSLQIVFCTLWRTFLSPAIGLSIAVILDHYLSSFSFGYADYAALIALFGSPMSVSAPVMTKEMGGDHIFAGRLVVSTCIVSIFSIFLTVIVCNYLGLVGNV